MNSWSTILELLPMQANTKLKLGSSIGFIVGLLGMTGHLDASTLNGTATDITTAISGFMALLSAFYFFEHSLLEVKDDLKNTLWTETTDTTTTSPNGSQTPPATETTTTTVQAQ